MFVAHGEGDQPLACQEVDFTPLYLLVWCCGSSWVEGQETTPQRVVGWHQKSPCKGAAGGGEAQLSLKAPPSPSMGFAFSSNPLEKAVWTKWTSLLSPAFLCRQDAQGKLAMLGCWGATSPHPSHGCWYQNIYIFFFQFSSLSSPESVFVISEKSPAPTLPTCCYILCWRKLVRYRRKEKDSKCPRIKLLGNANLAAIPFYPSKDGCPSSTSLKMMKILPLCLCTGLSSKLGLQCLLLSGHVAECFVLFSPCSFLRHPPRGIFHAFPHSLSRSGKWAAPFSCLRLWGLLSASKVSVCKGKTWDLLGLWSWKTYVTAFMAHWLRSPKLCSPTDACFPACSLFPWLSQWVHSDLLIPSSIHLPLPGRDGRGLQMTSEL